MSMIVVFGATGSTGTPLVRRLVSEGRAVRAAVRDVAKARGLLGEGVELVQADLERPATLPRALEGAAAVYCAVGGPTGTTELVAAERALIDAAKAARVGRYVKVSGVDASPEGPARIQRWHGEAERYLEASGLAFTVLRPNFFMQNFLGLAPAIAAGVLPLPTGDARGALIDARDIADVAAVVLTSPGHEGRRYTLTGPEALRHGEVAATLARELGAAVQFVDVSPEAFRDGVAQGGAPGWFADLLTDVYVTVFAAGRAARVTDDVARVTGRPPRAFDAFVRDHRAHLGGTIA